MKKINFVNNDAPYLNAENLNQLQANIEEAIGEIIESGSNGNGIWIKYADGTMICGHAFVMENQNTTAHYQYGNWRYPASFVEIPTVIATPKNWSTNASMLKVNPVLSNCGILQFDLGAGLTFVDRVNDTANVIAIGKWK